MTILFKAACPLTLLWLATAATSGLILLTLKQNSLPLTYFMLGAVAAYAIYGACFGVWYGLQLTRRRRGVSTEAADLFKVST